MAFLPAVLALLLVGCLTAEAQSNNATLPVTYPAKVLDESEQTCPPEEQREIARMEINSDIRGILQDIVVPVVAQGLTEGNPAPSCSHISTEHPSGYYWVETSD